METIRAKTDRQYDDGLHWLGTYVKETNGKEKNVGGNLTFKIYSEKITAYSDLKKFKIEGYSKENMEFIQKTLESLVNSEKRRAIILSEGDIE